jgi:hypothetical protein
MYRIVYVILSLLEQFVFMICPCLVLILHQLCIFLTFCISPILSHRVANHIYSILNQVVSSLSISICFMLLTTSYIHEGLYLH